MRLDLRAFALLALGFLLATATACEAPTASELASDAATGGRSKITVGIKTDNAGKLVLFKPAALSGADDYRIVSIESIAWTEKHRKKTAIAQVTANTARPASKLALSLKLTVAKGGDRFTCETAAEEGQALANAAELACTQVALSDAEKDKKEQCDRLSGVFDRQRGCVCREKVGERDVDFVYDRNVAPNDATASCKDFWLFRQMEAKCDGTGLRLTERGTDRSLCTCEKDDAKSLPAFRIHIKDRFAKGKAKTGAERQAVWDLPKVCQERKAYDCASKGGSRLDGGNCGCTVGEKDTARTLNINELFERESELTCDGLRERYDACLAARVEERPGELVDGRACKIGTRTLDLFTATDAELKAGGLSVTERGRRNQSVTAVYLSALPLQNGAGFAIEGHADEERKTPLTAFAYKIDEAPATAALVPNAALGAAAGAAAAIAGAGDSVALTFGELTVSFEYKDGETVKKGTCSKVKLGAQKIECPVGTAKEGSTR